MGRNQIESQAVRSRAAGGRGAWLGVALLLLSAHPVGGVELRPCPDFDADARAVCGTVPVREDRTHPDGRTLALHVMVLRARQSEAHAPLFLLAGGPGQAAADLVDLVLGPYAAVREVRDVVLVDQRGTGGSNRLDCPNHSDSDPRAAFGKLFDPAQIAACREQAMTHADPRLYGTLQVVADLDEVRERLGYERVVLWGGSGGTRTALAWLRAHPERIEAVALDGVTPTSFRAPSGYARWSQEALERVFADCDAQPSCLTAYPELRRDFDALLHLFDSGPVQAQVRTADGRLVFLSMSRGDFGYAVRGLLYHSDSIARLPEMIHTAATTGSVHAFAQAYWERDVALRRILALGVHFSVFGTEDVPFIDRSTIPELTRGTFLGTYLIDQYTAACAAWDNRGELPHDYHDPVTAAVPVLLVSGYYDPSTPPQVAAEVAAHLSNSRHVVVRNEAHGAGFGCARQLVVDFLVSGSLAGLGPACEGVGAIEFEVPPRRH